MTASLHRLLAGGALAAGAVTLGFATGGVAAVDDDLAAAARPAESPTVVQERFVELRQDCPRPRSAREL